MSHYFIFSRPVDHSARQNELLKLNAIMEKDSKELDQLKIILLNSAEGFPWESFIEIPSFDILDEAGFKFIKHIIEHYEDICDEKVILLHIILVTFCIYSLRDEVVTIDQHIIDSEFERIITMVKVSTFPKMHVDMV